MNNKNISNTIYKKCFFSAPFYASVKTTFKYYLKKDIILNREILREYEGKILTISSFLLISSAFMIKSAKEKSLDYDWQSYIGAFNPEHIKSFLLCAIRYLSDISEQDAYIFSKHVKNLKNTFEDQYVSFILSRYKSGKKYLDEELNMAKYKELLDLVLKIHVIYHEEMPKDSSKVMDLVSYTTD